MTIEVQFLYSGVFVEADEQVSLLNNVEDSDPSDRLDWLALDPLDRPASMFYFFNGNDYIYLSGLFDDEVNSGAGDDEVSGGDGNDDLFGAGGDDQLNGENGNDTLNGWTGSDFLSGGVGNDTMYGGVDDDLLFGNEDDDRISGGTGDDEIDGGSGNDRLAGDSGDDQIFGNEGNDDIRGNLGSDALNGWDGNDTMRGNFGDDYLEGGAGNDDLRGGYGLDELSGGLGADTMSGGPDTDYFLYASTAESGVTAATRDVINGFGNGDLIDVFDIDARSNTVLNDTFTFIGEAAVFTAIGQIRLQASGADTLVLFNTNNNTANAEMSILLTGLAPADVTASDFFL